MKAIVIYDSVTGHTKRMAGVIVEGMEKVEGVEAKACPISEVDEAWATESKCIILGTPTYCSSVSAAMKSYLDTSFRKCMPVGKLGGAFATADYVHGGGDLAIRLILDHMMVFGMLTFSGGGSYGKPVIHLGPVAVSSQLDEVEDTFRLYGERMAKKMTDIFKD